jgi:hypothetical protein
LEIRAAHSAVVAAEAHCFWIDIASAAAPDQNDALTLECRSAAEIRPRV